MEMLKTIDSDKVDQVSRFLGSVVDVIRYTKTMQRLQQYLDCMLPSLALHLGVELSHYGATKLHLNLKTKFKDVEEKNDKAAWKLSTLVNGQTNMT